MAGSLTDVAGFKAGHWSDLEAATGCTVVLCPPGTVGGASLRGFATGTRGTETLGPLHTTPYVDAVFLSGGSAFGLETASGVLRFLEAEGRGFRVGPAIVPIVAGAILFDLGIGDSRRRPGPDEGEAACRAATGSPLAEGSIGAGTGCTAGKLLGMAHATKTGLGSASRAGSTGLVVGALAAVNPFGDVIDPAQGRVVAGLRDEAGGFAGMTARLAAGEARPGTPAQNTTLGIVATNARLTKPAAVRLADQCHDALARTLSPVHTAYDGDVVFALASGEADADPLHVQVLAVEALMEAILRGALMASSLAGIPAAAERPPGR